MSDKPPTTDTERLARICQNLLMFVGNLKVQNDVIRNEITQLKHEVAVLKRAKRAKN